MKIPTINVIEESEGEILGVSSYPKTEEGRLEAKRHLITCVQENIGIEITDEEDEEDFDRQVNEEAERAAEEGAWYQPEGYYSVLIIDSNDN